MVIRRINNVTEIAFDGHCCINNAPALTQWDTGQVIKFLDVPDGIEVQFSNSDSETSINHIVENSQVEIPDILLQETLPITAYIVLIDAEAETTNKKVVFQVKAKVKPDDVVSPEDEQTFREEIQDIMNNTQATAQSVRNDADNGEFDGDSAYQVAVKNGYVGNEEQWLASLKGDDYVLTSADKEEIAEIVEEEYRVVHREDVFNIYGKLTENGYFNVATEQITQTENAKHTDYIDITGYDRLESFTWLNSSGAVFAFFDENKNYLSNLTVAGIGVDNVYTVDLTDSSYSQAVYVMGSIYDPSKFDKYYLKATKTNNIESQIDEVEEQIKEIVKHYNTFSILGDSYSTFAGYVLDPNAAVWYPASSHGMGDTNDVENVEQMWWYKFAQEYGCELKQNDSYSGSTIGYDGYSAGTDDGKTTSFITRADLLTITPELLVVFGGTNDVWVARDTGTTSTFLGNYKYANWTDADLEKFRPALACLFNKLKTAHKGARIVFILNTNITEINESVETICEYYNIGLVKLSNIDKAHSHPTEAGMTAIKNQLIDYLDGKGTSYDYATEESVKEKLSRKQDNLTAGTGISINNGVISVNIPSAESEVY